MAAGPEGDEVPEEENAASGESAAVDRRMSLMRGSGTVEHY